MEIAPLTKDRHQEWDEFCRKSDDAWFWHTSHWLEYTLNYRPDLKSTSLSFEVAENSKILAVCPLLLETTKLDGEEIREFSFGGGPTWAPAFDNDLSDRKRDRVAALTFEHISRLALENDVARASFVISPLAPRALNSQPMANNYLMKQGYMDFSLNTQIIDLTQSLETIRSAVRKGHNYDINRGVKELEVVAFGKDSASQSDFDRYRELHHKAAGRITRPMATFDMQYHWIRQGDAVLFGAKLGEEYVGFSYVFTYKKRAYYGSACSDPEYSHMPIGHFLNWRTIEWLKEHDYKYYEIGLQQYAWSTYDFPSPDEVRISFFKRGFGGFTVPLFRGEKYYSADYYLKVNLERVNKYASYLRDWSMKEI